jgi:hypothetical protein
VSGTTFSLQRQKYKKEIKLSLINTKETIFAKQHYFNSLFRVAVGTMVVLSEALAERPFPNTQLRVVGGVSGGT